MAVSIVSSIIFFILFIILSLFVDGKVFAAQMKNRKLGGAKEAMTMRRNLEENGRQSSKIDPKRKAPQHSGQKNTQHKPDTRPNQATAQGKPFISYKAIQGNATFHRNATFDRNLTPTCPVYTRCKRPLLAPEASPPTSSSNDTQGLGP